MLRILKIPYSTWEQVVDANNFAVFHCIEGTNSRSAWAGNIDLVYHTAVSEEEFKYGLSDGYDDKYETGATVVSCEDDAIANIVGLGKIYASRTSDNKLISSAWPASGSKSNIMSHNWCDPTTWYPQSVRVVDEVATDSGDQLTYNLANNNIIDTYHGKISQEDFLKDSSDNSYRVVVKVDEVQKTEQDPHVGSGGDYTIDYSAGSVTFLSALDPSDVVKVTYHYENGSRFTLIPESGKKISIQEVEVQFSNDINLLDTMKFQAYVTAYDIPVPGEDPSVYKTMQDYINDSNGSWPEIPKLGGTNWRSMQDTMTIFRWDYQTLTKISSTDGVEIRVWLENDAPLGGSFATATFYTLIEDV